MQVQLHKICPDINYIFKLLIHQHHIKLEIFSDHASFGRNFKPLILI
jgi:hypothetical protein